MAGGSANALPPRYAAEWVDRSFTAAEEVQDWGGSDTEPALAGRMLFDAANPVRTIRDTRLIRPEPTASYVEFLGGDRLPGRVIGYVPADAAPGVPAHLLVEPSIDLGFPQAFRREQVRVLVDWVSRIVQRPSAAGRLPPKTLRLLNGKRYSLRAVRWEANGLQGLTDSGPEQFSFAGIAEFALDSGNSWEAWQRQLAALSPGLNSRIVRMELAGGGRLTTSLERLKPRTTGGDNPDKWFHLCQPAWSLDLLAAPHRQIRTRTFFAPHETPLSVIQPTASRHRAIMFEGWPAHADENVFGFALRAGSREFAWGFGVEAEHVLTFELPRSARQIRTKLALDPAAGDGGSVRGRIRLGSNTLYESPLVVGSETSLDTGPLSVVPGQFVLSADAVVANRSRGSDPFEIRDFLNWLEPVVLHDPQLLRREVEPHYATVHPLLAGWRLDPAEAGNWRLVNQFDEADIESPCFRQIFRLDGPLTLSRDIAVDRESSSVTLLFHRLSESAGQAKLEISLDGRRVHEEETLPTAVDSPELLKIQVPVHSSPDGPVEFTVRLSPAGKSALVDWRGFTLNPATAK